MSLTLTHLTRARLRGDADAVETDSEGVVDYFRAVEGTAVARWSASCSTEGDGPRAR